jgi:hypothetical protein
MNPPTEISPSTQLLLDEIRKLFHKFDARWAKQDAFISDTRLLAPEEGGGMEAG